MMTTTDSLIQRQQIVDVCVTYALALDAKDWDRLRSVFLPEAIADYGEELGSAEGYNAIQAACRAVLDPLSGSQHLLGNHLVTLDETRADAVSYFQATHVRYGTTGGDLYTIAGRYDDRFVLTPEGWRISRKTLTVQWVAGNPVVLGR